MKESTQTLIFIAAALGSVLIASQSTPTDATYVVDDLIGQSVSKPFKPDEAKALRIVRLNEETATLSEFEVAEDKGVWSLPSKGGYPADAERKMAEATTGVSDREILSIATQSAADHAEYGVIEPSTNTDVGETGVGTRVVLTNQDDEPLVDLVIGKQVKGAEDQHYVRRTSQDIVFTVEIDPDNFSTTFEDWIESDLLDLSAWDIARVEIKDYSSQLVPQMTARGLVQTIALDPRADLTLDFDDAESVWLPNKLLGFNRDAGDYEPFELADDQELNKEALDGLKDAVGDLKIIDVERKPAGLSGDLKAGEDFYENDAALGSLMRRGFAPTAGEGGADILSTEGEVRIGAKSGVEYVLRFGKLHNAEEASAETTASDPSDPSEEASSGIGRYLFVMAQVNEDLLEAPELEIVPEETPEEDAGEEGEAEATEEDTEAENVETDSRAEVEKRNQRKQDAYNEKVADAQRRVDQLNDRFGDWYYVISDEVYKKIALDRDDVIVTSEKEESEAGEASAAAPGPLGAAGAGIPGLPNVPGVEFNPGAADEAAEDDAAETAEAVEEAATE